MELLRTHDLIVRAELAAVGGSEVKHTGDGIMASFPSVAGDPVRDRHPAGVRRAPSDGSEYPILVRIGVERANRSWSTTTCSARRCSWPARACDHAAGRRDPRVDRGARLAVGKGFRFEARGPFELKGFEELIPLFEVAWRE